ncbi:MAG TPA: enoyl-CoA hydratase/isomerase family protein [Vicinamibacterales bacterium]|jgi:enoyl-CoA hydratase/carnithine racemase
MTTMFETDGPLAILTFNRPEARNAMTWEMYDALVAACEQVDADPSLRALILRGAGGKAFVSGTDIAQFRAFRTRQDGLDYEARLDATLDRLERLTKPAIAQIEGVTAGGGCAIAVCCDLRIATPESTFGVPVARTLGNCLSGATYARIADLVGTANVKDMMFTGRMMSAADANAIGLVTRIVPSTEIGATVRALALEIASNAPLTIRATKEMLRRIAAQRRLAAGADRDLIELCYTSEDFKEGVRAFLEKRRPVWNGR